MNGPPNSAKYNGPSACGPIKNKSKNPVKNSEQPWQCWTDVPPFTHAK